NESWISRDKWIIPESHSARAIGMSTDKEYDKMHYAEVYAIVHEDRHGRHTEAEVIARFLACVNACTGIPNVQLECDKITFIEMLKDRNAAVRQRDELLAAAKDVCSHMVGLLPLNGYLRDNDASRADLVKLLEAIASASK
ncbi:MAG TPA: hypothetical protein VIY48_21155, partial [Candidatus Paceibacterota bacterium]